MLSTTIASASGRVDTFLHLSEIQWIAVQGMAVAVQALVLIVTLIFAYKQLRQVVRNSQFDAVHRMQQIMDSFREERKKLFESLPLDLMLHSSQFPKKPPHRWRLTHISEGEHRAMLLTDKQRIALNSLTPDQIELCRTVINYLNDIGQMVEDGFIPKDVFFGKYHLVVIRCCYLIEAVRRHIEEQIEGGNYGQRLLRLRHHATCYNDIMPKHRDVVVYIRNSKERKLVYESPTGGLLRRFVWTLCRAFNYY